MNGSKNVVDAYRKAAVKLFGISETEAQTYIVAPKDDTGEWAPNALAIVYLEADCRKPGDDGTLPALLGYYSGIGMENCVKLSRAAGVGFVEYINPAVAAVWE
jgi:hypothetical protein